MENTNKNQISNVSIFLIVLLLVAGGFLYFKNIRNEEVIVIDVNNDNTTPVVQDKTTTIVDNNAIVVRNNTSIKVDKIAVNKARFNVAFKNGNDASVVGDYVKAISYFNEALKYQESDSVYIRLFTVYGSQNDWTGAMIAIDKAIDITSFNTDYWVWKIQVLNERMGTTFSELKRVYEEGMTKANPLTRVNLATNFARISEQKGDNIYTISLWEQAIELYPSNEALYQAEIDRLLK